MTSEKVLHFTSSLWCTKIELSTYPWVNQCKYLILFLRAYIDSPLSFATLDCCFKLNDQNSVFLCLCGTLITQQLVQCRWQKETLRHNCDANKYIESKNIGKMFNEKKYSVVFHPGRSLVSYVEGKPVFLTVSWNNLEIIFDKTWY